MLYPRRRRSSTQGPLALLLRALLLLAVSAFPVYATGPFDEVSRIMDQAEFSMAEQNAIRDVFQNADNDGIPVELLTSRLQEGVSKRVGPRRIVSALRSDVDHLQLAREVARAVPGGADLLREPGRWARALTVLQAGYSPDELRTLFQVTADHPERFRFAAALFVSVRDWGLDSAGTTRIVEAAARSNLPPQEYAGIAEIMAAARRQRIRPRQMVDRIVLALQTAETLSALRRKVLQ